MKNKSPLISIIVPIYNVEDYLSRCIDSIINQTYKNLEIILVDDGSRDKSGNICDEYLTKDSRIAVYHKTNGGLSDARNFGIEKSTGEYIGFIDGDDYVHPQMYEILYYEIIKTKCDVSACKWKLVKKNKHPKNIKTFNKVHFKKLKKNKAISYPEIAFSSSCNKLYKKDIFKSLRYPIGKLHEDECVFHRIIWQCDNGIAITTKKLYFYTQRSSSIMGSINRKRIEGMLYAFEDRIIFAQQNNWTEVLKKVIGQYLDYCVHTYVSLKNGWYGKYDQSWLDLLYDAEKSMLNKGKNIYSKRKYELFAKNPQKYERIYYNLPAKCLRAGFTILKKWFIYK